MLEVWRSAARARSNREMVSTRSKPSKKAKRAGGSTRRYVALLRGVSPMNAKMPELARCFEAAGFSDHAHLGHAHQAGKTGRTGTPRNEVTPLPGQATQGVDRGDG
jgi:hypothetical protein